MDKLEASAAIQILKPIEEVFEAIVDPKKMTNYFISESTGRMEEGKKLSWKFPEFGDRFPVNVMKVKKNESIIFDWDAGSGEIHQCVIRLSEPMKNATVVEVKEGSMPVTDKGLQWMRGNTEGWANFLACMKAYLEYGINLRKGAFDYQRDHAVQ